MMRASYACDCMGERHVGRENPRMTDGVLDVIEDVTGARPPSCPWSAFRDPLVQDVVQAYRFFESGQLQMAVGPEPPPRIVDGLAHYHAAVQHIHSDDMRRQREEMRKKGGG